MSTFYTTSKNARRAARKQGLEQFEIEQTEEGFVIVVGEPANENAPTNDADNDTNAVTDDNDNEANGETPTEAIEIVIPEDVSTSHPVAFVWAFLDANRGVSRKILIRSMIDMGLNPNMTKTQTSRWYKVDGDKDAYLAIEKAKRDAEKQKIDQMAAEIRAQREDEQTSNDLSDDEQTEQTEKEATVD